ncbi:MAG: hypothetical protein ACR2N4_04670 [Jatrophihabitans sp.]
MRRQIATIAVLAGWLTLTGGGIAHAHGVLEDEGPVLVGNVASTLSAAQLPAGVSARLREDGYALRVVNHSAGDLRLEAGADADSAESENADSETADADAGAEHVVRAGSEATFQSPASAVTDEDVKAATGRHARQLRSWQVTLTAADGRQYQLQGEVRYVPPPSPVWPVLGVLAVLAVATLAWLSRLRWPDPRVATGLLGLTLAAFALETAATVLARDTGEDSLDVLREYLPQLFVCVLGVLTCVLVWRRSRLSTLLTVITLLGIAAGLVARWPLLWSSSAITVLAMPVDRLLVLVISAAALATALRAVARVGDSEPARSAG